MTLGRSKENSMKLSRSREDVQKNVQKNVARKMKRRRRSMTNELQTHCWYFRGKKLLWRSAFFI